MRLPGGGGGGLPIDNCKDLSCCVLVRYGMATNIMITRNTTRLFIKSVVVSGEKVY